jgi:aldehyde:ferredoxin oxidoreductase
VFGDLFEENAELLRLVTGWNVSAEELRIAAPRIVTAKKLFNIREGWTAAEDTLPNRFFTQDLQAHGMQSVALPRERLQEMIQAYYAAREWDREGKVPLEVMDELQLTDF